MAQLKALSRVPSQNRWEERHNSAITDGAGYPVTYRTNETPIVHLVTAWTEYALSHKAQHESLIGNDYVLGPAWVQIGESIRTMLNGDLGRLDAGTIDSYILDTMLEHGVDTEAL